MHAPASATSPRLVSTTSVARHTLDALPPFPCLPRQGAADNEDSADISSKGPQLRVAYLNDNQLTGSIPAEWTATPNVLQARAQPRSRVFGHCLGAAAARVGGGTADAPGTAGPYDDPT